MLRLFSDPIQSESIFWKVHFNSNFSSKRYDKIWKIKKPFSLRPEHIRKHLLFQHIIQMIQSVLEQEIFSNWIYHQHLHQAGCRPFKELINILWILELKLDRGDPIFSTWKNYTIFSTSGFLILKRSDFRWSFWYFERKLESGEIGIFK